MTDNELEVDTEHLDRHSRHRLVPTGESFAGVGASFEELLVSADHCGGEIAANAINGYLRRTGQSFQAVGADSVDLGEAGAVGARRYVGADVAAADGVRRSVQEVDNA
ncbi:MAG: hypothetical protein ACRCSN_13180 [Dermatophilaceae bacterium]